MPDPTPTTAAERLTESLAKNDRACARYPMIQTHSVGVMVADLRDVLAENARLRAALSEVTGRLLAFCGAVADVTDCSADVDAINRAEAVLAATN